MSEKGRAAVSRRNKAAPPPYNHDVRALRRAGGAHA
jgi:hypothetical protein